jgi:hypothetical protein
MHHRPSYLLHHLRELLGFVRAQDLVVLDGGDVELVLGLRLGGFERAGEDRQLHIAKLLQGTLIKTRSFSGPEKAGKICKSMGTTFTRPTHSDETQGIFPPSM